MPKKLIQPEAARKAADAVPGIPRDESGPVFRAPWEAHAFAMALALYEKGLFAWSEWSAMLGEEIGDALCACTHHAWRRIGCRQPVPQWRRAPRQQGDR